MSIHYSDSNRKGVTLVEVVIVMAFLSTVVMATALAYTKAAQALVVSKARGVAARLAQDKFETLRGLPYNSIMVTTQTDLDVDPPGVDQTYYPPETINMGGNIYTRSTIVSRVFKDVSGNVIVLAPNVPDTGIKQITTKISYPMQGVTETRVYTALVSDPNLVPLDAKIYGVTTDTSNVTVPSVKVFVTQNQNWTALSSTTGYYEIQAATGTYTVTATKAGYWDKISASLSVASGPNEQNLQLLPKSTGKIEGLITARPKNLLISGVYAGPTGGEFLELYNPTTYQIMIRDGLGTPQIAIKRIRENNNVSDITVDWINAKQFIPAEGYYLIATSSPTANNIIPDAIILAPANPFSESDFKNKGGVAVQDLFAVSLDTVGWTNSIGNLGPSNGVETAGIYISTNGAGAWTSDGVLERFSGPLDINPTIGGSVDSNNNSQDMWLFAVSGSSWPRNSVSGISPVRYGIPASSAAVLATDGFSAAATASSTGYYLLNSVTTGTWSVAGYWTTYSSATPGNVQVNAGVTTTLDLLLEPSSDGRGGISGRVVRSDTLSPLSNILINAGTTNTRTDAAGNYVLSLTSGSYTVIANDGFDNVSYNTLSATATAPSGGVTTGLNFNLNPAGVVTGKVTTNGTDGYPNFSVHAIHSGLEIASGMTNSLGNFSLYGIPVGANIVEPIIDTQSQASSPSSRNVTVAQGNTHTGNNFTVTDSLGKITGTVKQGSYPITTGVLIVASTATLSPLPVVNNAFRTGNTIVYSIVSDTAGNYSLNVVRLSTYTVYAYYPSLVGTGSTSTATQTASSVYVTSSTAKNFQW